MFAEAPALSCTLACSTRRAPAALDGEALRLIHEPAAVVVALAGISLGVLVGHDAPLCLEDRGSRVVLRGNHHQGGALALKLAVKDVHFRADAGSRIGSWLVILFLMLGVMTGVEGFDDGLLSSKYFWSGHAPPRRSVDDLFLFQVAPICPRRRRWCPRVSIVISGYSGAS